MTMDDGKKDDDTEAANIEPTGNDETNKVLAVVGKGAKWGAGIGFAIALVVKDMNSPLGFYLGNLGLLFLVTIGGGAALGALIAWLSTLDSADGSSL